jgi:Sec-independent protein translocase protein TatA
MNILGIGGPELLIILVLMLVIAGPKRMIKWAYIMGQYVAKFRRMWAETVDVLQHEFDDAGVDLKIPRDLPTRGSLNREAGKMLAGLTDPVKETLQEVDSSVKTVTTTTSPTSITANKPPRTTNGHTTTRPASSATPNKPAARRPAAHNSGDGFGTWSSHDSKPDFGSWTSNGQPQGDEE